MSDYFETNVTLTERDIAVIGNVFVQYFHANPSAPDVCSPEPALFKKILDTRAAQIIEARAAGLIK